MANQNDVRSVNSIYDDWKKAEAPAGYDDAELFELFSGLMAIREYDISVAEAESGLLGGGDEGGTDVMYTFVNGSLYDGSADLSQAPDNPLITLFVIQAKREKGFSPEPIHKIKRSLEHLIDVYVPLDTHGIYTDRFVQAGSLFQEAVTKTIKKSPRIEIRVVYSVKDADVADNDAKVGKAISELESTIPAKLSQATASVELYGARRLIERWGWKPSAARQLVVYRSFSDPGNGWASLVRLSDYYEFLKNDIGGLAEHLFEGNVRGVQGNIDINRKIRETVEDPDSTEFWWLNNGVTIVCEHVSLASNRFTITDPSVVNGLQTSWVLFEVLASAESGSGEKPEDDRLILVRVIQTTDDVVRDQVIRATNSQTPVRPESLVATEALHRDIEAHFKEKGLYYDRRKGHWRYKGIRADDIFSVRVLAQAMVSMALNKPHEARARPSSIFKTRTEYEKVFNPDRKLDLDVYVWAAKTQRLIDVYLRPKDGHATAQERSNFQFHIGMLLANRKLLASKKKRVTAAGDLQHLVGTAFGDADVKGALDDVRKVAAEFQKKDPTATLDQIAKNKDFTETLLNRYCPLPARKPPRRRSKT